ncbi:CFEM domain-containing protein [Purpureocillium lavendulum]|uniref:CFEM domain-containing protein n=1 Tax=Purpureocillium lavendulum TaxID=1247861 RepID=A0AB34FYZ4_9HYPO|nr:CFEM domain-containing protein [Purpureocillium lavendulum]
MKSFAVVTLALASLVAAQSRSDIPSCALPCLDDAVKASTSCATDDFSCICASMDKVQGAAAGCILSKCGQDKALNEVLPAAKKLCANAPAPTAKPSASKPSGGSVSATVSPTVTVPPTQQPSTTAPTTGPPTVTAGAAAFAPVGGLAALVAVLAL